jgi:hypothetical protein
MTLIRPIIGAGGLLLTLVLGSAALGHPPAGKLKPLSPETRALLEAAKRTRSEADLLAARRALAQEGRYSCCITGGCTECLIEGVCACGPNLLAKEGVCRECVAGWKVGVGKFEGIDPKEIKEEKMGTMRGATGPWRMNREGTGTSWLPEASPMYGSMRTAGRWNVMTMGYGYGVGTQSRGENRGYLSGYGMASAWNGKFGVRAMASVDPVTLGRGGYPLLFQEGEGLTDRQHPHDLLKELAFTATGNLRNRAWATLYLAPVGEPALGPTAYVHRPSALDNPEAPLTHHVLDATHITPGVVTGSLATRKLKIDASLFNGRDVDNRRTTLDTVRLDSRSVRLSVSPSENLALQISQGYLAPEKKRRTTASALGVRGDWNAALAWSSQQGDGQSWLLEATRLRSAGTVFFRAESVVRPLGQVGKLTLGGVKERSGGLGIGASLSVHAVPGRMRASYGRAPLTGNIFLRVRTGKM